MHRNTVVNGTIDLKCLNIECAFHLTQSGKFVSFSLSSIPMAVVIDCVTVLVAFCIIYFPMCVYSMDTYCIAINNPGVFFWVCLFDL